MKRLWSKLPARWHCAILGHQWIEGQVDMAPRSRTRMHRTVHQCGRCKKNGTGAAPNDWRPWTAVRQDSSFPAR